VTTQALGWTLVHFVWQGSLIAAGAAVLLRLTRSASAGTRYIVACAGLAAMLATSAFTFARLTSAADPDLRVTPATAAEAVASTVPTPALALTGAPFAPEHAADGWARVQPRLERSMPVIVTLWLLGVALLFGRLAGGWLHVRRRLFHQAAAGMTSANGWPPAFASPARSASSSPRSSTCPPSSAGCARWSCCRWPRWRA